ncbi:hypothetical protein ABZ646_06015 [Streptomyces sp. NPDC007162]|uniref:hypothetical protein n=1 Tax=Streptomyces sp. NPDC007162 TaxID=3156917 RepID=UPI003408BF66
MTIVALFGLAVLGFGNAQTANGTSSTQPNPSVTYPIRFDTPAAQRTVPTPSVSYPIDLSALGGER